MEIIPAIDLLGGRCVRLFQGDFARVTSYAADPLVLAAQYLAAGARTLHVVDLDGARSGVAVNQAAIHRLADESGLVLQAGGGIRSPESLKDLLAAGVSRVVIGSVAITDPDTACRWLDQVGPERLVIGLDVRCGQDHGSFEALAHGWQQGSGRSLWALGDHYAKAGARYVLCTDVGRDGTLSGPNCDLYTECVRRFPDFRWIASGGVSSAADLPTLAATGVSAVVTGKALLDGQITMQELSQFLRAG
ncbi:MAG: 1-(5-phosphoribosyl)-5-[(5-phosphoribosylamino) methylideneamino] imidazole-4-carboxamide isomerase [Nevskiales bacterium]